MSFSCAAGPARSYEISTSRYQPLGIAFRLSATRVHLGPPRLARRSHDQFFPCKVGRCSNRRARLAPARDRVARPSRTGSFLPAITAMSTWETMLSERASQSTFSPMYSIGASSRSAFTSESSRQSHESIVFAHRSTAFHRRVPVAESIVRAAQSPRFPHAQKNQAKLFSSVPLLDSRKRRHPCRRFLLASRSNLRAIIAKHSTVDITIC